MGLAEYAKAPPGYNVILQPDVGFSHGRANLSTQKTYRKFNAVPSRITRSHAGPETL